MLIFTNILFFIHFYLLSPEYLTHFTKIQQLIYSPKFIYLYCTYASTHLLFFGIEKCANSNFELYVHHHYTN